MLQILEGYFVMNILRISVRLYISNTDIRSLVIRVKKLRKLNNSAYNLFISASITFPLSIRYQS